MPDANHYADKFWNDLPQVLSYLCRRATGDSSLWWMDYFKSNFASRPFSRGLVIGCGNGWVERDLYDRGIASHFDAFDFSAHYLEQCEQSKGARSIRYWQDSFETFNPEGTYDLIVNVAALHHARYLHSHLQKLQGALSEGGVFVNWDYTGPSRNQYSDEHVNLMRAVNEMLPARFRTPHALRPDLRTLLAGESYRSGTLL